jgi:single-strand DNA-binding protein
MANGNNVTITGNATRDPEVKYTPSGSAVATFGVAINRRWQNRSTNEWEEAVTFIDVVAWDQLAENVQASVQRGTRVTVSGRLDQRTWETQDGEKKSKVEVVADDVAASLKYATAVVTKRERGEGAPAGGGSSRAAGNGAGTAVAEAPVYATDEEPFVVPAESWWPEVGLGRTPGRMLP